MINFLKKVSYSLAIGFVLAILTHLTRLYVCIWPSTDRPDIRIDPVCPIFLPNPEYILAGVFIITLIIFLSLRQGNLN